MGFPPALLTARLKLVPLDRPLLAAFVASRPDFSRWLGTDVPEAWSVASEIIPFVLGQLGRSPATAAWLPWAIIDRSANRLIGDAGCKEAPDLQGGCEIGYSVAPSFRQRGFATEAVAAIIAWARQILSIRVVRAEALYSNQPSQRVLEKNGFTFVPAANDSAGELISHYEFPLTVDFATHGRSW